VFVAIVSPAALSSTACGRELDWAEELARPVLPVAVERASAALPVRFARRQIVDYSQPKQRERAALMLEGGLAVVPAAPPLPDPLPEPPAAPLSYLTELVDLVAQPNALDHAQQHQILQQLGEALRSVDREERGGGRDTLERFASRADIYADVDRTIGALRQLADETSGVAVREAAEKPAPPPAKQAAEASAETAQKSERQSRTDAMRMASDNSAESATEVADVVPSPNPVQNLRGILSDAITRFYPSSVVEVRFSKRGEFEDPKAGAKVVDFDEEFSRLYGYAGKIAAERDRPLTLEKLLNRLEKLSDTDDWNKLMQEQMKLSETMIYYWFTQATVPIRINSSHPIDGFKGKSFLPCVAAQVIDSNLDGPHRMYLLVVYIKV
jgi:hypothetical protein